MTNTERNRLIEENMPLVSVVLRSVASRLPLEVDRDDLRSCGVLGLVDALAKWDERKGSSFATYAKWRIRGAMLDELRRLDPSPRRIRARRRLMDGAVLALQSDLGREPTDDELCVSLGLTALQLEHWQGERPYQMVELDRDRGGDDEGGGGGAGPNLHETLSDGRPGVREVMERAEMARELVEATKGLPLQMRLVMGYVATGMNLGQIGRVMMLTESRIHQIKYDAIKLLRLRLSFAEPLAA